MSMKPTTDATPPIAPSETPVTPKRTRRYIERKPEQVARILAAYATGRGARAIAVEEGVSEPRVTGVLRRAGVTMRPVGHPRIYTYDPTYFDAITDEPRAYWLGFLMADGCITDDNRLTVTLAARDQAQVAALRAALSSNHPITESVTKGGFKPGSAMVHFNLRCARIAAGLARHGVTPRKSHTAVPPELPEHLRRHFWRGMVDGDGYISVSDRHVSVGLTGNRAVCDAFAAWVHVHVETRTAVTRNNSGWKFCVSGGASGTAGALLRLLYANAEVALERKALHAHDILAMFDPRGGR